MEAKKVEKKNEEVKNVVNNKVDSKRTVKGKLVKRVYNGGNVSHFIAFQVAAWYVMDNAITGDEVAKTDEDGNKYKIVRHIKQARIKDTQFTLLETISERFGKGMNDDIEIEFLTGIGSNNRQYYRVAITLVDGIMGHVWLDEADMILINLKSKDIQFRKEKDAYIDEDKLNNF